MKRKPAHAKRRRKMTATVNPSATINPSAPINPSAINPNATDPRRDVTVTVVLREISSVQAVGDQENRKSDYKCVL